MRECCEGCKAPWPDTNHVRFIHVDYTRREEFAYCAQCLQRVTARPLPAPPGKTKTNETKRKERKDVAH